MKTTRLQMNATTFKATRDIMSAYFGVKYDLAVELAKAQKATADVRKVIATDEAQLSALAMGKTEIDGARITRTIDEIRQSLEVNVKRYNADYKAYNAMVEKTSKAVADAEALFDNKDSKLYKAYAEYVVEPTDDRYNAYASAMAERLVELGLKDATADNVAHYMPNADRELRGKTAVKKGDIRTALNPKPFSKAVLGKFYTNNKACFANAKFAEYVRQCADKAKNAK